MPNPTHCEECGAELSPARRLAIAADPLPHLCVACRRISDDRVLSSDTENGDPMRMSRRDYRAMLSGRCSGLFLAMPASAYDDEPNDEYHDARRQRLVA